MLLVLQYFSYLGIGKQLLKIRNGLSKTFFKLHTRLPGKMFFRKRNVWLPLSRVVMRKRSMNDL